MAHPYTCQHCVKLAIRYRASCRLQTPGIPSLLRRSLYPPARWKPRISTSALRLVVGASRQYHNPEKAGTQSVDENFAQIFRFDSTEDPVNIFSKHIATQLTEASGLPGGTFSSKVRPTSDLRGDLQLAIPSISIGGQPATAAHGAAWLAAWPGSNLISTPVQSGEFLVFYIRPEILLTNTVSAVLHHGKEYGKSPSQGLRDPKDPTKGKKRIVIDFSSPNIAKPFHAGHFRSTILGAVIANIYESMGWNVIRINYLGDWGKQFGLLAVAYQNYGNDQELKKDPIRYLYQLYVRISKELGEEKSLGTPNLHEHASIDRQALQYVSKLEKGDIDALALWKKFRDLSIEMYENTYSRLNVRFDAYRGESQVPKCRVDQVVDQLVATGLTRESSDGGILMDFRLPTSLHKHLGAAIIRKLDGTSIYLTRDIAEAQLRHETYQFDRMLYVIGQSQYLHVQQLIRCLHLLGESEIASKCKHIPFENIQGMSTRRGTAIFLEDILDDVRDKVYELSIQDPNNSKLIEHPQLIADSVGVAAAVVQDLKVKREKEYKFSLERMTQFHGDTGPYLQYTHARLCSLSHKSDIPEGELPFADMSLLTETVAIDVVRLLVRWPHILRLALHSHEPAFILAYLFQLSHAINRCYKDLWVLGQELELRRSRMALYTAARHVLANGLKLLTINPVTRM